METAYDTTEANSSGQFRWMAAPESHLGIIVLISKGIHELPANF